MLECWSRWPPVFFGAVAIGTYTIVYYDPLLPNSDRPELLRSSESSVAASQRPCPFGASSFCLASRHDLWCVLEAKLVLMRMQRLRAICDDTPLSANVPAADDLMPGIFPFGPEFEEFEVRDDVLHGWVAL